MTALLIVLAFAADPDPEPGAKFDAKLGRADKFASKVEKGVTVWEVSGGGGIGNATVTLKAGEAPKKVVVRLPGLSNLEMFSITAGGASGNVRLGSTAYFTAKGGATKEAATLTLTARSGKDCVEVEIVTKEAPKEWVFNWINEYRRIRG